MTTISKDKPIQKSLKQIREKVNSNNRVKFKAPNGIKIITAALSKLTQKKKFNSESHTDAWMNNWYDEDIDTWGNNWLDND